MKKLALVLMLLLFYVPVLAADGMATRSFDVSKYSPNEVDFVKATISSMNIKGWEVDAYEKGKLTANYKKKHVIEVLFDGKKSPSTRHRVRVASEIHGSNPWNA
jgi:hypothetical protein